MNQRHSQVASMILSILECSVYAAPTDPGMTIDELQEAARKLGLQPGETRDALNADSILQGPKGRLLPNPGKVLPWLLLRWEEPEFRNFEAFDFIHAEFMASVRAAGLASARIDRAVLVERGAVTGLKRHDLEVALTILVMQGRLVAAGGVLSMSQAYANRIAPRAEREQHSKADVYRDDRRARAYPVVVDIASRRSDGRRLHVEPLDAFGEELERLGYGHFRLWWGQMVAEMRRGEPQFNPVAVTVLCAALVEGALTFVVQRGRALRVGPFGSKDFEGKPRSWSIDDLVKSAASGGPGAILDQGIRARADKLIRARQRIHAGRMLEEHPRGVPDLWPDEARESVETATAVVRRILDWLEAHPWD